jgi:hypothetical protein
VPAVLKSIILKDLQKYLEETNGNNDEINSSIYTIRQQMSKLCKKNAAIILKRRLLIFGGIAPMLSIIIAIVFVFYHYGEESIGLSIFVVIISPVMTLLMTVAYFMRSILGDSGLLEGTGLFFHDSIISTIIIGIGVMIPFLCHKKRDQYDEIIKQISHDKNLKKLEINKNQEILEINQQHSNFVQKIEKCILQFDSVTNCPMCVGTGTMAVKNAERFWVAPSGADAHVLVRYPIIPKSEETVNIAQKEKRKQNESEKKIGDDYPWHYWVSFEPCVFCNNTGMALAKTAKESREVDCESCTSGSRLVKVKRDIGFEEIQKICSRCNGSGRIINNEEWIYFVLPKGSLLGESCKSFLTIKDYKHHGTSIDQGNITFPLALKLKASAFIINKYISVLEKEN